MEGYGIPGPLENHRHILPMMRELPPLDAPKVVANQAGLPIDDANLLVQNFNEFSFFADSSNPPTPTLSSGNHSRYPSSSSSIPYTIFPSHPESADVAATAKRSMPQLPEHPGEDTLQKFERYDRRFHSFDEPSCKFHVTDVVMPMSSQEYELEKGFFDETVREIIYREHSRSKSGDSSISNISSRFPTFRKRWRHKKNSSFASFTQGTDSMRSGSSRSSTMTFSSDQNWGIRDSLPSLVNQRISREEMDMFPPPMERSYTTPVDEPFNRRELTSTPLLPPKMDESSDDDDGKMQSPLQYPSIASADNLPDTYSTYQAQPSPNLNSKPSMTSINCYKTSPSFPPETSPFALAQSDKWCVKLGHSNFTIFPEPYLPEMVTAQTYQQFIDDWNLARTNFFRHQARTLEHYGPNSKTYRLTEEKWAEVEVQWRRCAEEATAQAAMQGERIIHSHSPEPVPMMKMPPLRIQGDGKFPTLGDGDIVGPMIQAPARVQSPTRKSSSLRLLGDIFVRGGK